MLDKFLAAAYNTNERSKEKRATVESLKKLSPEMLSKLASGKVKLSDLIPSEAKKGDGLACWLEQFKDTPFADQAMALEQQDLALDMQDIQQRQQRQAEGNIWDQKDQLRLQKKLLELQLYQSQMGGEHAAEAIPGTVDSQKKPAVPEAGKPGAGAMGPEAENSEENMAPVGTRGPGDAKTAFAKKLAETFGMKSLLKAPAAAAPALKGAVKAAPKPPVQAASALSGKGMAVDFGKFGKLAAAAKISDAWGRELARADAEKIALTLGPLAGMAGKAMTAAKANPQLAGSLVGAGVGAAGGALVGGPDHRLSGALGGAAAGGALGHAGGGIASRMAGGVTGGGKTLGEAAKGYAGDLGAQVGLGGPARAKPGVLSDPAAGKPAPTLASPDVSKFTAEPQKPGLMTRIRGQKPAPQVAASGALPPPSINPLG